MIARSGCIVFVALLVAAAGCDQMPLLAPLTSTITLFAGSNTVQANGSMVVTATITEVSGTPVQNGTLISFTTSLGQITPSEARTSNGKVTVTFTGNGQSGEAQIQAISGGAKLTAPLTIKVGGAAASRLLLTANPGTVSSSGGSSEITAIVTETNGSPLASVPVNFSTDAGTLSNSTATTDAAGQARTTLTTNRVSIVTATAGAGSAGAGATGTVTVRVNAVPTIAVTAPAGGVFEDQPATFTLTVTPPTGGSGLQNVVVNWGDGSTTSLGNVSGSVSISHTYTSADVRTLSVSGSDQTGEPVSYSTSVNVQPRAPIDVTFATTQGATPGDPVAFTVTADATNATYAWNFGDGTTTTVTGKTTSHDYLVTPGTYRVQLTVSTADGRRGNASRDVAVN